MSSLINIGFDLPGRRDETFPGRWLRCRGQSDLLQAKHFHVVGRRQEDLRCPVGQDQGQLLTIAAQEDED